MAIEEKNKDIEKSREPVIQSIATLLRHNAFTCEFKVKKKPKGIRIIMEVTREQLDGIINQHLDEKRKASEK